MSRTYHQRARILVVDNSEINREMLNDILGETYEIRLAGSGREALEILEKEHWNLELVLLKLEMPDIDGYELLEIMREKMWLEEFAVIAVIASLTADVKRAYRLGVCDCFRLPYVTSILSHRIENAIVTHEKEYRDYLTGAYNRRGFIYMVEKFLITVRTDPNTRSYFLISRVSRRPMNYLESRKATISWTASMMR